MTSISSSRKKIILVTISMTNGTIRKRRSLTQRQVEQADALIDQFNDMTGLLEKWRPREEVCKWPGQPLFSEMSHFSRRFFSS
jgi:hypothetical protein